MALTVEVLDEALLTGPMPSIGQITPELAKHLGRRIRAGEVFTYRGFWDTCSPDFGLGQLKTIYALTAHAGQVILRERQASRRYISVPEAA